MKKIIFNSGESLSWKTLLDMIIKKAESNLQKYMDSWEYTWMWITAMRMPAYELVWEKSGEVFDIITKYVKENWKPYKDDVESFFENDKDVMAKWELQVRLETECPVFFSEYKDKILSVIEDYVYIPDFIWRDDYIYDFFIKDISKENNLNDKIRNEMSSVKNIVRDIADWKYFQKLKII